MCRIQHGFLISICSVAYLPQQKAKEKCQQGRCQPRLSKRTETPPVEPPTRMHAAGRTLWPVERKILLSFSLPLFVLLVVGLLAYRTVAEQAESSRWMTVTNAVIRSLFDLHASILEADNAARAYILSGREEYLLVYQTASGASWGAFASLEREIVDTRQRRRLTEARLQMLNAFRVWDDLIKERRNQGLDAAKGLLESGNGQMSFRHIYGLLRDMDSAEEELLAQRAEAARGVGRRMQLTMASGVGIAFLTVFISWILISRDMAERKAVEVALRESREVMQDFLDNAHDLIHIVDSDGCFLYVNRIWKETLGYDAADLASLRISDIFHPEHRETAEWVCKQALSGATVEDFETVFVTKGGQQIRVSGHINVRLENGVAVATRSIFRDVTERKQAEEELQRSNEVLLRSVTELEQRSREIVNLSEMGDLLQSCQSAEEAYRIIAQSVPQIITSEAGALSLITSSRNLVEMVASWGQGNAGERVFQPDDCWALRRGRMNVVSEADSPLRCPHLKNEPPSGYLCVPLVAQGEALGLLSLRSPMRGDEEKRRLSAARQKLVGTVADRIALAIANLRLREAMRQQSVRDPLTGLYNRRHMEEALEREVRRAIRSTRPLGILMMDLDNFKRFNDSFGHEAGDTMLREFGSMLSSSIRGGDIACRYGGEEFAVILPEAGLDATRQRAEQLRTKTRHLSVQHRGTSLGSISLSIGVAAFPEHGSGADILLRAADSALYAAKSAGRDRVETAPIPASRKSADAGE